MSGWHHAGNPEEDSPASEKQIKFLHMHAGLLWTELMTETEKELAAFEGPRWFELMTKGMAGSFGRRIDEYKKKQVEVKMFLHQQAEASRKKRLIENPFADPNDDGDSRRDQDA